MEDFSSSDEDYYYSSDRDSLDGFENDESDSQWVTSKSPTTKVITKESLLAAQVKFCFIFGVYFLLFEG